MIYYQHTALKPQFSQAFLNMAIKKSIFRVPRISVELFRSLKHYLPTLLDGKSKHCKNGKLC